MEAAIRSGLESIVLALAVHLTEDQVSIENPIKIVVRIIY